MVFSSKESTICPICKKNTDQIWQNFEGAYTFLRDSFVPLTIKKWGCSNCNHIFSTDNLDESEMERFYQHQDRERHSLSNPQSLGKVGYYDEAIKSLEKAILELKKDKKNVKILDIGCGSGEIILSLKDNHPDLTIHGIDINPRAKELEKYANIRVNVGKFPENKFDNQTYDIVIINGVLEHQKDVYAFLNEVKKIINKSGEIFIEVPYSLSIIINREDLKDKRIHDILNDEHLHHFSTKSLHEFVERSGFTIIDQKTISKGIWDALQIRIKKQKDNHIERYDEKEYDFNQAYKSFQECKENLRKKLVENFSMYEELSIYGAGWHTAVVLPQIDKKIRERKFKIFDNDERKQNCNLFDRKINSPTESNLKSQRIILSTLENADVFRNFLQKLINNSADSKFIDIYAPKN